MALSTRSFLQEAEKQLVMANYMQIHIKQVYAGTKDTVLMDTREYMSRIQVLDSVSTPLAYYKISKPVEKR